MVSLFKTLLIIISVMYWSNHTNAQPPIYNTCSSLSNYNGEWKYQQNDTLIKFYFRTHTFHVATTNEYIEELLGWHEYSVGGQVIESDYSHRFDVMPTNWEDQVNVPFSVGLNFELCKPILTYLYGGIFDITRNRSHALSLNRLTDNTILIKQYPSESTLTPAPIGFTLPRTFTLTRQ